MLEAVFEPHLRMKWWGFRPGRNCHKALKKLNTMLEKRENKLGADKDKKGFFDHLDHEWIVKFMESRIKDPKYNPEPWDECWKPGIGKEFHYEDTEEGSGQGSESVHQISSKTYICISICAGCGGSRKRWSQSWRGMQDWWCMQMTLWHVFNINPTQKYSINIWKAEWYTLDWIEESKTRLIEFGRFVENNRKDRGEGRPETFTILDSRITVPTARQDGSEWRGKPAGRSFAKKSRENNALIRDMRFQHINYIVKKLNEILVGYYHYYGITDNSKSLKSFII